MQRSNAISAKLNLKLYDIDGCLFHIFNRERPDVKKIKTWLIESNKAFFEREIAEVKSGKYDKVVVAYGTNRQDYATDHYNSYPAGSCTPALPIIQNHLESNLDCPVLLDPFWMADIYGQNRLAGTSYKLALMSTLKLPHAEKHAEWMFDASKISLIYAHIHRVAALHPESTEIDVDFYDDKGSILEDIHCFFTKYPQLLPKNLTLRLHHYKGTNVTPYKEDIWGTGIIDVNYEWSVRFMASMSYSFTGKAREDLVIKTGEELRAYHEDDHYHAAGHNMLMYMTFDPREMGGIGFDLDRFMKMRDNEIPSLVGRSTLGNESNYTTSEKLYQEIGVTVKSKSTESVNQSSTLFSEKVSSQEVAKKTVKHRHHR